jgi:hypothetical protein
VGVWKIFIEVLFSFVVGNITPSTIFRIKTSLVIKWMSLILSLSYVIARTSYILTRDDDDWFVLSQHA